MNVLVYLMFVYFTLSLGSTLLLYQVLISFSIEPMFFIKALGTSALLIISLSLLFRTFDKLKNNVVK